MIQQRRGKIYQHIRNIPPFYNSITIIFIGLPERIRLFSIFLLAGEGKGMHALITIIAIMHTRGATTITDTAASTTAQARTSARALTC